MDFQTIIGIIIGVCFLLVIIGGKRKKRDPKTSQASRAASSSYNSVRLLNREEERCFNALIWERTCKSISTSKHG